MTISPNRGFSASSTFFAITCALAGTFASTAAAQTTGGDDGSHWLHMFDSSGAVSPSSVVELVGGQPPVLGTTTSVQLVAPGFDFGFIAISGWAGSGFEIPIGPNPIDIFLDPGLSLGSYALPMPGGQAQLPLPLPPDPALSGLELGFQGLVMDPVGNVAATNLAVANIGLHFGGAANVAFMFGGNSGISISRNSYWEKNNRKKTIVSNPAGRPPLNLLVCIQKQASNGVLEIRLDDGTVLATIAGHETGTAVPITVPAGRSVHFFNSGTATINGLKWSFKPL